MKYIFINIKNFIHHEKTIFVLMMLCIFYSVMVVCFTFGFYHHLEQKKLDAMINEKILAIEFIGEGKTSVKKDDLMELVMSLSENTLNHCYIEFGGHFNEDKSKDPIIEHGMLYFGMDFAIRNGKVTNAPLEEMLREDGVLYEGRYFTAEEIENGELVCVGFEIPDEWVKPEENMWQEKYNPNSDGTYTIDGKIYKCIGKLKYGGPIPMLSVKTVDNDSVYIQHIYFEFEDTITRAAYTEITEAIRTAYGEVANIPEFNLPEVDSMRFYNTLLILCILLIGMSGMVVSMLYQYIMLQRRRQLTIYRLCGMTKKNACRVYFMECFSVSLIIYIFAVCVFHFGLLPFLSRTFEYISASYSIQTYCKLGGLYIGIISVILYAMIRHQIGNNVCSELREV